MWQWDGMGTFYAALICTYPQIFIYRILMYLQICRPHLNAQFQGKFCNGFHSLKNRFDLKTYEAISLLFGFALHGTFLLNSVKLDLSQKLEATWIKWLRDKLIRQSMYIYILSSDTHIISFHLLNIVVLAYTLHFHKPCKFVKYLYIISTWL